MITTNHDKTAGPVTLLALAMLLLGGLGVPNELVQQDTLKSIMVCSGTLLACTLYLAGLGGHGAALRWHPILGLPLALCLYAVGSMAWSHAYLAGSEALRWSLLTLLLALLLQLGNAQGARRLAWGIHGGAVCAALWAAQQFWFDRSPFPQAAAPASTFINRNFLAEYLVCALPYSLWLLATARRRAAVWLAASVVPLPVALLMTATRSALLALVLVLPLLGLAAWRYRAALGWPRWGPGVQAAVIAVLLAGSLAGGLWPTSQTRFLDDGLGASPLQRSSARMHMLTQVLSGAPGALAVRGGLWKASARMLADQPWSGVGAGAWEVQLPRYQGADNSVETDYYAHNEYLQLLAEYGLPVGGICLAFLLAYCLLAAQQTWQPGSAGAQEAPLRAVALCSLLALAVVSGFGFPWHLAGTGALGMVGLAFLGGSDLRLGLARPRAIAWGRRRQQVALAAMVLAIGACSAWFGRLALAQGHYIRAIYAGTALLRQSDATARAQEHATLWHELQAGLELDPHQRQLASVSTDLLMQAGYASEAAQVWERLVLSRPNVPNLWANLALIYLREGQPGRAQTAWRQLQRLQPSATRTQVIEVFVLARTGDVARAQTLLRHYLSEKPPQASLLDSAYVIGRETHDWPLCLEALHMQIAQGSPGLDEKYYRLGEVLDASGDAPAAQRAYAAGLAAAPAPDQARYRAAVPAPYQRQLVDADGGECRSLGAVGGRAGHGACGGAASGHSGGGDHITGR